MRGRGKEEEGGREISLHTLLVESFKQIIFFLKKHF